MQEPNNDRFSKEIQDVENTEVTVPPVDEHASAETASKSTPAFTKKARSQSRPVFVLILAIFMAALGAFVGIVVYKAYFERPATEAPVVAPQTPKPTPITAKTLIDKIKSNVKAEQVEIGERAGASTLTKDKLVAYSVPIYKPSGYTFSTIPAEMFGVSTSSSTQSLVEADVAFAKQHLESKGLKADKTTTDTQNNIVQETVYSNDNIQCIVRLSHHSTGYRSHIGCADASSYVNTAKQLKPLHEAYLTSAQNPIHDGLSMGSAIIENSSVAGYKRAEVSMGSVNSKTGGFKGLFYQGSDEKWHWLIGTQSIPTCTSYPEGDARKAFAGQPCTDTNGNQIKVNP